MAIDPLTGQQIVDPRENLSQVLLSQGFSASPVETPIQGVGRLAQALVGAKLQKDFNQDLRERASSQLEGLSQALGGLAQEGTPQGQLLAAALQSPESFRMLGSTAISSALTPPPRTFEQELELRRAGASRTNVSVGGEKKFSEELAKGTAGRLDQAVQTARTSVGTQQSLNQLGDLLASGEVKTGTLQPAITSIQGLAKDLGLDVDAIAKRAGIESIGKLGSKEEFDRLAKTVIIDGFEKFKGNLNAKEVKLAEDAFANLGKSEEGNIKAIAALKASNQLAIERGRQASQIQTQEDARAFENQFFAEDVNRFEELRQQFEEDLMSQRGDQGAGGLPEGVPEGSQPAGTSVNGFPVFKSPDGRLFEVTP